MTRFSVGLPQLLDDEPPELITRYAARAEALGFTGLWTIDNAVGGPTGHTPALDAAQVLAFAATAAPAARLGIAVIVMPRRQPALLAKELASLDRLTGGRLIVGVGLGADTPAAAALGFPTDRRARRLAEGVQVMRALWTQAQASHAGELYRFEGVRVEPKPLQRPHPPVWFGAGRPPALRRAARLGDGWIGAGSSSSDDFEVNLRVLRAALNDAGRDPGAFPVAKRVYIAVEDSEQRARERLTPVLDGMYGAPGLTDRVAVCGPPERCAQELRRLIAAGAGELLLNPLYGYAEQLEALAEVARLSRE
jgi:probable F420-dependent oxidoreductase